MFEPIAPAVGRFWFRHPGTGFFPVLTKEEAHQKVLSHAVGSGLQGRPYGSYIRLAPWLDYAETVGSHAEGSNEMEVWIAAFAGEFVFQGETYPYMAMALTLSGDPVSDGFYPNDRPMPFPVRQRGM